MENVPIHLYEFSLLVLLAQQAQHNSLKIKQRKTWAAIFYLPEELVSVLANFMR